MRWPTLLLTPILFLANTAPAAEVPPSGYPSLVLANPSIKVHVYLPDAEAGYHRGPRFDWSGMISRVEFGGHVFFTQFRTPHDPANFEAADGVPDEFGMDNPPGYDEAAPGETFLKIGVGLLEKPAPVAGKSSKYDFFQPYKIARPGEWTIRGEPGAVQFEQELSGPHGYAYRYTKRIELTSSGFVVKHRLKNTGSAKIDTNVYCHNFFSIDDRPVGPAYRVDFAVDARPKAPEPFAGITRLDGDSILFAEPLQPGKSLWAELESVSGTAEENRATVSNSESGASVTVVGDAPVEKIRFYAEHHVLCPEFFVALRLDPGEEKHWQNLYTFATH